MVEIIGWLTIFICSTLGFLIVARLIINKIIDERKLYHAYWQYLKTKDTKNDKR